MDEFDEMTARVRLDRRAFAEEVAVMRRELADGLGDGAERGARVVEAALLRAVRTGSFGFEELKATALSALDAIAAAAVKAGVDAIGAGAGGGGLLAGLGALVRGLPGRATGGPVTAGRGYLVGERGPELFVPTGQGRVEPLAAGGVREVRVAISVQAGAGEAPAALARSGRQVARAVRAALAED